jgi:hypothetical protein
MKILGPALAGAAMQLMAIGLLMVLVYFLASAGYFFLGWPFALCEDETACQAAAPLVRLSYLITAVGIALTSTPLFAQTKLWARHASRTLLADKPKFSAEAVAVQFSIVTIACIVEKLEDAPQSVTAFGQWMGGMWLGVVLWPAMWSIVIAAAGSQAHALYLSAWEAWNLLDRRRRVSNQRADLESGFCTPVAE